MLSLTFKVGQSVHIGDDIIVKVREVDAETGAVKLGFDAPRHITIDRESVRARRIASVEALTKHARIPNK